MPLPLNVLSGFLGSGKTTLLNRVLTQASSRNTAVLINEFGAVGIDHHIVSQVSDDVVLLESGCVCCRAGEDIGAALTALLRRRQDGTLPAFERVILETSGLAQPGLLLQRFLSDASLAPRVRIDGIVTVVDAVFGSRALEEHAACGEQIAMANRIVISKTDLIDEAQLPSLIDRLHPLNPRAPRLALPQGAPVPETLFSPAEAGVSFDTHYEPAAAGAVASGSGTTRPGTHASRYQTFCLQWREPLAWGDFQAWIEGLLGARGESLLRIKGILHIEGEQRPMLVQAVQHALYAPTRLPRWPRGEPCSELVFITRDFSSVAALNSFRQLFALDVSVR
jgi:G3E family GTPase